MEQASNFDKENGEFSPFEYTLLIVEANRQRALNLKYILDGLYNTSVVRNIEEAKVFLSKAIIFPDLIVSNYNFIKDGGLVYENETTLTALDLCKFIRSSNNIKLSNMPIITIIETNDSKLIAKLLHEGINDVLEQPYDILELFSRIETQISIVNDKQKLIGSIQDMEEDIKVRTRKNIDFRTKILAKHRETAILYEDKIKNISDEIVQVEDELKRVKGENERLRIDNSKLINEIRILSDLLKSKNQNIENNQEQYIMNHKVVPNQNSNLNNKKTQQETQLSLEELDTEDLDQIVYLMKYINSEFLFEENSIKNIADKIIESGDIDFKKIDNFYFVANAQKLIRKWVKIELESIRDRCTNNGYLTRCRRYLNPTVDYLLKLYINRILFFLSMNLLEAIGSKDDNATKFLKFYDGRVEIASNGVRYQKPLVGSDEKDGTWNIISMIQIINQRSNGQKLLIEHLADIQKITNDLDNIKKDFENLVYTESSTNHPLKGELNKNLPIEEKFDMFEKIINDEMRKSREYARLQELEQKAKHIFRFKEFNQKYKTQKDSLSAKYTKQVAYYKPTEEKFAKVALSVAKIILKVKVIS